MTSDPEFLKVKGNKIVNQRGDEIRLRGFCLGGFMHMENFMLGYPGHESGMREAIADELGDERAKLFFEKYRQNFFTEDDVKFIRSLGCNTIRVALNYREFESDDRPFEYKQEGFEDLDRLIGQARKHKLYVILDLHAVQGWQNGGWHSDNFTNAALFWGQKIFEDRAVALWGEFARRYRDEEFIAGYNLVNEPNTDMIEWLNHYYHRVARAIRAIDPNHILFLEGNRDSQQFDGLDHPFDENAVYSSHLYVLPGVEMGEYPGEFNGTYYDRDQLEKEYEGRREFSRLHGVPHWLGEFGTIYPEASLEESRLRVMADMLSIIEAYADHWTIWNYKDIGLMGVVSPKIDSEWMRITEPVRKLKTALRCDHWIERSPSEIDGFIQELSDYVRSVTGDIPGNWDELADQIHWRICDGLLSQNLQPAFAAQFRDVGDADIDRIMKSFSLENCHTREDLVDLIKAVTVSNRNG
jgi:endoglucanase